MKRTACTTMVGLAVVASLIAVPHGAKASPARHQPAAPGTLLSATPTTAYLLPGVPFAANAWHITYRSTTPTGTGTTVSGTVLVPKTPFAGAGKRPLVGFAVGSQGMADKCAASAALKSGTEYESANIEAMLTAGWAVAVTDYPGLGTPGDHTYAIGRSLGPSVLDSMRAARHLAAARLAPHGPAAIMGYSEGGGAAGWAAQLQPTYAPDVPLVGASVGGVIANLHVIAKSLDGGPVSFLIPYTAIGMEAAYPKLHLDKYLTPTGRADVAKLKQSCLEDASAVYLPFTKSRSITTRNLFTLPLVKRIIASNHLGRRAPATPILLQQSPTDEVLPYSQAVALAHDWCTDGAQVDFRTEAAPDHVTGGLVADPISIEWLAQRFAGKPLGKQCAS